MRGLRAKSCGNGLRADVLAIGECRHRLGIEAEPAEVVGEVQRAAQRQPRHRRPQQAHVLALHVEIVGARGVRERRRIAEDQVVAATIGLQPCHRIGLHQAVSDAADAVLAQVVGQPFQVGRRQIDAGRRGRATDRGLHRHRARVAEQVEETLAARFLEYPLAQRTMVEEQAGIEVVEQVHAQPRRALAHHEDLAARSGFAGTGLRILAAALAACCAS